MVKVMAFALTEGKVAVHCHAGIFTLAVISRAWILMTCDLLPCEIYDAIQYINLGYGAQAPKIVIL